MARTTTSARSPQRVTSRSRSSSPAKKAPTKKVAAKADQAQQQASRSLRGELDERSGQVGAQLGSTAADIRQIAGHLRQQDNDSAAKLADLAAEQIDRAAGYLSSTNADALIEDVERLARSKPWLATGAAALTGFVASRALSASSRSRS